jgi:hypothetical protein
MVSRKRSKIPPLSPDEAATLSQLVDEASLRFSGTFDELESAAGMLMIGRLYGWRVLVLIHNKRTIRKYEEILGIKVREAFPEEGPLASRSNALAVAKTLGNFWKAVSGELKIPDRREIG